MCKTNIKDKKNTFVQDNSDDLERLQLLDIVYQRGINALSKQELVRLSDLVEKKDYSHNSKAEKSKRQLLKKIAIAIYDHETKYGNSFKAS